MQVYGLLKAYSGVPLDVKNCGEEAWRETKAEEIRRNYCCLCILTKET